MTHTTSESQIEQDLITHLKDLKYIYREDIRSRDALERNFREHFQRLNNVTMQEDDWQHLDELILGRDTFDSSKILRERHTLLRSDGTLFDFTLLNTRDWCKNTFEVINQLKINTDNSFHRYDVILLLNGIPVVQIELKRELSSPRKALEQIVTYKNDKGNGYKNTLLAFIQLFIVSNRTSTFYFANNSAQHFSFHAEERYLPVYTFADQNNKPIHHLAAFTNQFLAKCTLAEMISRYMVLLETERKILMMRPYQIYAVKNIVECIQQNRGNGYIWHTTGSGKTLTSFKASTLLRDNPDVHKCIFVVDRKDLDRQTREEFNRFQEGAVEQNTDTAALVRRLLSEDKADKVIVTTIQKLALALTNRKDYQSKLAPLRDKRIVFIFDECHRSQFGKNHEAIREFFPYSQLFGFTGTPIFKDNATSIQVKENQARYRTTEELFQQLLHSYTISDAIDDRNVLKFKVEYYSPDAKKINPKESKKTPTQPVEPKKEAVVEAILAKHDTVTASRKFNAIFATASIDNAIEYYDLFQAMQKEKAANAHPSQPYQPLNIACVFSPPPYLTATARDMIDDLTQETADYQKEPEAKRQALERIIADYNQQYGTNHNITEFDAYYQDLQGRIKSQQYSNRDVPHKEKIDIVIVVDMLLTGFDSKYLNTLYLDKRLVYHGLIQAMSRTNRILNDTKPYGNILDFRGQQEAVDKAITLFSGTDDAAYNTQVWLVEEADAVVEKLKIAANKVAQFMEINDLSYTPSDVLNLKLEADKVKFVQLFKEVQRLSTQLDQYTDLTPEQEQIRADVLPNPDGFKGAYLELVRELKIKKNKPDSSQEDLDFELVLFATAIIDYDYIMTLLANSSAHETPEKQIQTRNELLNRCRADSKLMEEYEELADYIRALPVNQPMTIHQIRQDFEAYKAKHRADEIYELARAHGIDAQVLQQVVTQTVEGLHFANHSLERIMEPLDLSWKEKRRKKKEIMGDLIFVLRRHAGGRDISGLEIYEE